MTSSVELHATIAASIATAIAISRAAMAAGRRYLTVERLLHAFETQSRVDHVLLDLSK